MARTLNKGLLPPGSTGFLHQGIVYVPGDDGKTYDLNGQEVALPDEFPSDDDLAANLRRAARSGALMAPLTKSASGDEADDEDEPKKGSKRDAKKSGS